MPRSLLVFVLTIFLVLTVGMAWTRDSRGVPDDTYWDLKMAWEGEADVVFAGDSRTKLGASPAAFAEVLEGTRALNFGFDRAGFSEAYLDAAAEVLAADAPRRIVLLGITPHALSRGAIERNRFDYMRTRAPRRSLLGSGRSTLAQLYHRLTDPIPPHKALLRVAAPEHEPRHIRIVHADGWVESDLHPRQPEEGFDTARRWFDGNECSDEVIEGLLAKVEEWRGAGIEVYAYRPPTDPELARLEDSLGGFDEASFRARLREAGGRWIDLGADGWETFDSSHLTGESARRMSRRLAEVVKLTGQGDS